MIVSLFIFLIAGGNFFDHFTFFFFEFSNYMLARWGEVGGAE